MVGGLNYKGNSVNRSLNPVHRAFFTAAHSCVHAASKGRHSPPSINRSANPIASCSFKDHSTRSIPLGTPSGLSRFDPLSRCTWPAAKPRGFTQNLRKGVCTKAVSTETDEGVDEKAKEGEELPIEVVDGVEAVLKGDGLPKRWVIVGLCFTAFLLCNMDRVRDVSAPCSAKSVKEAKFIIRNSCRDLSVKMSQKHRIKRIKRKACQAKTRVAFMFGALGLSCLEFALGFVHSSILNVLEARHLHHLSWPDAMGPFKRLFDETNNQHPSPFGLCPFFHNHEARESVNQHKRILADEWVSFKKVALSPSQLVQKLQLQRVQTLLLFEQGLLF